MFVIQLHKKCNFAILKIENIKAIALILELKTGNL
ncbi:hypothetical protein EMST110833_10385 [Empedobacter stercoris]